MAGEETEISLSFAANPLYTPFTLDHNFGQAHFASFSRNDGKITIDPAEEGHLGEYVMTMSLSSSFESVTKTLYLSVKAPNGEV